MTQYQLVAPRSNRNIFFGLHLYLAERCCKNLQSARGLAQCKSGPAITWLVDVTIYCTIFQKQFSISPPTSPVLRAKYFKKKLAMENADWTNYWTSIEGPWAFWRTCTPTTGYFHDKTKISKENLRVDFYLLLKCSQRQLMHFTFPYLDQITYNYNLTPKCKMLNVFWT